MKYVLMLVALTVSSFAMADASNLQCQNGFVKVATYSNAIKCKRTGTFASKFVAQNRANIWASKAKCNSNHWNTPSKSVRKVPVNKYKAAVTFTCAIIL